MSTQTLQTTQSTQSQAETANRSERVKMPAGFTRQDIRRLVARMIG